MITEIDSPALERLSPVTPVMEIMIQDAVSETKDNPGFVESGRVSRRIPLGEEHDGQAARLHRLASEIAETFLNREPQAGSTALLSVVTDAEAFKSHVQASKAASNWHQDFVTTERGFFFTPEGRARLIIPTLRGPFYAVGQVGVMNAMRLEATTLEEPMDRDEALRSGPAILGADGVLVKSETNPIGGEIHEAEPNNVYAIPLTSVHKASPLLPEGRVFFQLDSV